MANGHGFECYVTYMCQFDISHHVIDKYSRVNPKPNWQVKLTSANHLIGNFDFLTFFLLAHDVLLPCITRL